MKRKSYDSGFKSEAVKLAKETSVRKASADLGIPENTLRNWQNASETRPENPFIGSGRRYISPEDADKAAMLRLMMSIITG